MQKQNVAFYILIAIVAIALLSSAAARSMATAAVDYLSSFGPYTAIAVLIFTIITTSLGIPLISFLVAGALLGMWEGVAVIVIASTIGVAINFGMVRWLGRPYVEKRFSIYKGKFDRADEFLADHGFITTVILRMSPVPFELTNILGGLSKMRFSHYILASFIGIIPGTILVMYVLKSASSLWSWQFLIAGVLLTMAALVPLLFKRVRELVF